ncbi:hypothetical protein QJQ45_021209 [Haematococcus lacustris]|nr:hypothetical protein QJQ45_021209 [Haematococcus lacustris]
MLFTAEHFARRQTCPRTSRRCVVAHLHEGLTARVIAQDTPEQVTLHLLTRLRKPDPESLATLLRDPGHWPPSPEQECSRQSLSSSSAAAAAATAAALATGMSEAAASEAGPKGVHMAVSHYTSKRSRRVTQMGPLLVEEAGPLDAFAHVLDAAARRVLPGHLLRRCRILSSLQLGSTCMQRVALTACTGEEAVFMWRLQREQQISNHQPLPPPPPQQQPDIVGTSQASSLAEVPDLNPALRPEPVIEQEQEAGRGSVVGAGPSWRVTSVTRDSSRDEDSLQPRPHPRLSPELVILAQLAAIRAGDLPGAAAFNLLGPGLQTSTSISSVSFQAVLHSPAFRPVLQHRHVALQAAATASSRRFVQLVELGGPMRAQFVWDMRMHASGSWMTSAIVPVSSP